MLEKLLDIWHRAKVLEEKFRACRPLSTWSPECAQKGLELASAMDSGGKSEDVE